jgi:caa(3)-type oxidase subunit IV
MAHDAHEAHGSAGAGHGHRQYFITWCWLLGMSLLALGLGYAPVPESLKALLLVSITLAKIVLIGSIFMHLKFERMNLVLMTFSPLVLSIILFFIAFGESRGSETHFIETHQGAPAAHAAPAEHK